MLSGVPTIKILCYFNCFSDVLLTQLARVGGAASSSVPLSNTSFKLLPFMRRISPLDSVITCKYQEPNKKILGFIMDVFQGHVE